MRSWNPREARRSTLWARSAYCGTLRTSEALAQSVQALDTRSLLFTDADWLRTAQNARCPSAISLDGLELRKTAEDAYTSIVYLPVLAVLFMNSTDSSKLVKAGQLDTAVEGVRAAMKKGIDERKEKGSARSASYAGTRGLCE